MHHMNKSMLAKLPRRGLTITDALVLALPFLGFILAFGLYTDQLTLRQWPPQARMSSGFWGPVIIIGATYLFLLMNAHSLRKHDWTWKDGLVSVVIIVILWVTLAPTFERSLWIGERRKLGLTAH
jgi:hypothetical protein